MSSIDLAAPSPTPGPFAGFMGKLGVLFSKMPLGFHKWPQAAQRVATVLAEQARHCRLLPSGLYEAFVLSDPMIRKLLEKLSEGDDRDEDGNARFRVGRRCIQKGLKQLEDIGVIRRFRRGGVRFIQFLVSYARPTKPASPAGRARKRVMTDDQARRSDASPRPGAIPAVSRTTAVPAAEKPPDPGPDTPLSPAEIKAQIAAATATATATAAATADAGTTPGRRVGPSLGAAVPKLSEEERARRVEEKKRLTDEWFAQRKQAREAAAAAQDPPDVPPAPSGREEIARE